MEFRDNEVKEVGPGVWMRVAVDNIAWCDLGEWAVVIDALEDPEQADVVRDLIRETTGKELKYIVTTHWDADHIACNPQWRSEGAVCIAHKSCAESAELSPGRPDIWYDDRASLRGIDDKSIQMQWAGGTHTPWDTFLYFPHAQVLHIADLFGWGLIPCKPTPEKIARLREVYDRLLEFRDAQSVIVGHGPTCTLDHLRRFRSYMDEMLQSVPPLIEQGKSDAEIAALLPAPSDMADWWRFTDWKHAKNIELIRQFSAES
jgi:cyclase